MGDFCTFSKLNISVIFDDRASLIITGIQKLISCLSKKYFFNDLDLQYQGQIAHAFSIALFCQTGQQDYLQTCSKLSKKHSSYSWTIHTARIFENNCISLNGGRSIKCPNFFKFSMLNIFVMFEDRSSCIITDIYELIFYLSEKCIFNDLELQFQGQIAFCLTWHYLYSIMVAQNFPKNMATALGQNMPQYHLKKISLRLNGGILPKMGDFC